MVHFTTKKVRFHFYVNCGGVLAALSKGFGANCNLDILIVGSVLFLGT